MPTASPLLMSDDHLDLLGSAAISWVCLSETAQAFSQRPHQLRAVAGSATALGRQLRSENAAAVTASSERGCIRLVHRRAAAAYTFRPVAHLEPVEVIKAAHAAQEWCASSPSWEGSASQRILSAIITAAIYRVDGYAAAPWSWTRPRRRAGRPVGVTIGDHPVIPGLTWVGPDELRAHWERAPLVVVPVPAAGEIPPDLASRAGVFLLVQDEQPDAVWNAVATLEMQEITLFWPICREWLADQLAAPARNFVEFRSP